jgi:hypothetical protein
MLALVVNVPMVPVMESDAVIFCVVNLPVVVGETDSITDPNAPVVLNALAYPSPSVPKTLVFPIND